MSCLSTHDNRSLFVLYFVYIVFPDLANTLKNLSLDYPLVNPYCTLDTKECLTDILQQLLERLLKWHAY